MHYNLLSLFTFIEDSMLKLAKLFVQSFALVALITFFSSCKSKVKEASPETVEKKGDSVDDRIKSKALFDSKIFELQKRLDYLQNPAKQILAFVDKPTSFTLFEIFSKILSSAKSKVPDSVEKSNERRVYLNHKTDFFPCEVLEAEVLYSEDKNLKNDKLTIQVKTCEGKEFLPVLTLTTAPNQQQLEFIPHNVNQILKIRMRSQIQNLKTLCNFEEAEQVLKKITCNDLKLMIFKKDEIVYLLKDLEIDMQDEKLFYKGILNLESEHLDNFEFEFYQKKEDLSFYMKTVESSKY